MNVKRSSLLVSAAAVALIVAGCTTAPEKAPARPPVLMPPPVKEVLPLPQPEPVKPAPAPLFTPATFAELPGWAEDDQREAWSAFTASCSVLGRRAQWAEACTLARGVNATDLAAVRAFFESNFVPNLVRAADGSQSGLITGYYEAMLRGSRIRSDIYQTPLYRVPDDLLTIDLASVYPQLKNMRLRGRVVGKKVVPYDAREQIDSGKLAGNELLWVDDPVEAFFLEVQGSGRVQLDNGETVRISYADQNGHPYKAIGRWLIEKGELPANQVSAQSIKAWIAANPHRRQELFNANPSFIFFREERIADPSVGPKGALNVPLTPARSVAIDPSFLPLGAPIYLATTEAGSDVPMRRLVMGQDTGGAIRGEVRADFFYGFGPEAADKAGRMKQPGTVWVLLPKGAAPAQ
ncbi:murein transglycosylase A [Pseudoduganella sp. GCM10020061]|uniref:murein transglycosylase A n=1 Tax=Pseudoduganella sp. GCM10020061 TaxID=3317345 RepID=UPI003630CE3C